MCFWVQLPCPGAGAVHWGVSIAPTAKRALNEPSVSPPSFPWHPTLWGLTAVPTLGIHASSYALLTMNDH